MLCPVCQYQMIQSAPELEICSRCGHGYRTYNSDIIEYHKQDYRRLFRITQSEFDENGKPTSAFHKARKKIVRKRIKKIKNYLNPTDVCLDIGAGGGTFANAIRNMVSDITCSELETNLADECEKFGFRTLREDFLNMRTVRRYDIVFAWHVIEHIENIVQFIEKALTLTKRYFICEIPYKRNVPKKFDGHLHYFSETSLRFLLHETRIVEMGVGVQAPALFAVVQRINHAI